VLFCRHISADILALREFDQPLEAGLVRQVENTPGVVVIPGDGALATPSGMHSPFCLDLLLGVGELVVGVAQEDQPQHGDRVLGRFESGISAQFVGGVPEAFFDLGIVGWHVYSIPDLVRKSKSRSWDDLTFPHDVIEYTHI